MNMSFLIYDNGGNKNPFPAGPAYLAAVLRDKGYSVSIYHQNIYHTTEEEVKDYYEKNHFDWKWKVHSLVGFFVDVCVCRYTKVDLLSGLFV